jgi:hypothetical protein
MFHTHVTYHRRYTVLAPVIVVKLNTPLKAELYQRFRGLVQIRRRNGQITKLYDSLSISVLTQLIMKTIIPKSGLAGKFNKVAVPLILRCTRNSTNYKSHYIPFGLYNIFLRHVPLPKSLKPSRVRFLITTGNHLPPNSVQIGCGPLNFPSE